MDDTGLSLQDMRELLREGLGGLDEVDLGDEKADRLLNISLWSLDAKFPFKEKECRVSTFTVATVAEVTLPNNLDAIRSIAIFDAAGVYTGKLIRSTQEDFDSTYDSRLTGQPRRYFRRNGLLVLSPTPDAVYKLELTMWRTLASLLEGTIDYPTLPRNWHDLVVQGAIVKGHFLRQNYDRAAKASNFMIGEIRSTPSVEGKEERDSRYAKLNVIRTEGEWEEATGDPAGRHGFYRDFYGSEGRW